MNAAQSFANSAQLLTAVARGELDWRELERVGAEPGIEHKPAIWREPICAPVVEVRARDVAIGLMTYSAAAAGLREWAQAMEMCGCFDFSILEGDADGELLLEAVWSASFGEPIDDATWERIREIATGRTGEGRQADPAMAPGSRPRRI